MRILHTSDWHLGRTLHGVDLGAAHQRFFEWLVELVRAERIDAVVVAGDVYDRALPPLDAVAQLEQVLRELTALCPVLITPGNHDSAQRLGFGASFYTDRLRVMARADEVGEPTQLTGRDGESLLVYGLPYLDPEGAREALLPWGRPDADGVPVLARSHESVIGAAMRAVEADLGRRRSRAGHRTAALAMAHAFAIGGEASESERDISVGGVDSVPTGTFGAQLDYVALGHLHGPQQLHVTAGPHIRYSGSPLAFSFSERSHRKSVTVAEFAGGTLVSTEQHETPVPRRLSVVTDTLEAVLSDRYAAQRDDWVRVTVRQDTFPDGYFAQVARAFPHALQILHETTAPRATVIGPGREAVPPIDVAAAFVADVAGRTPTAAERAVLADACTAAQPRSA